MPDTLTPDQFQAIVTGILSQPAVQAAMLSLIAIRVLMIAVPTIINLFWDKYDMRLEGKTEEIKTETAEIKARIVAIEAETAEIDGADTRPLPPLPVEVTRRMGLHSIKGGRK